MDEQQEFELKDEVWSGASMLYTSEPMRSLVVEVETSSQVQGEVLQAAVDDVLKRAPYFGDALAEREGSFHYAKNPLPMKVAEGGLRAVGGPETNWHNLDVTFEGNTMSFAMFHAFCDGMGLNLFVDAVLNRYFSRKDGVDYPAEGLRVPGQSVLEGEEADGIVNLEPMEMTPEIGAALAQRTKESYVLPEASGDHLDDMHAITVHVAEGALLDFARSCGSSPAPTLAALMAEAVFAVHPECDMPVAAMIPTSTRKALDVPNTFKNAAGAAFVHFDPNDAASFAKRASAARASLRAQVATDVVRFANAGLRGLIAASKAAKTYAEKAEMLNITGRYSTPISVDYVGGLHAEGFEDQLVSIRYLSSPLGDQSDSLSLFVTATAGRFDLVFARNFATDVYDKAFLAQLDEHGIPYELGGERNFMTPRNGLIPALGLASA